MEESLAVNKRTPHNLLEALRGALSADAAVRVPYEAALAAWEAAPGYATALLSVYESPPAGCGGAERLLAVLCLKAAVGRRWNERRSGEPAISDAEKAEVRARLLPATDEREPALASQLVLTAATIARLEGLAAWPALLPALTASCTRPAPLDAARGLSALYRVVKLQASRRLLAHRKAFFALSEQLHAPLASLRTSHARALLGRVQPLLGGHSSPAGPASQQIAGSGAGGEACALLAIKTERQLLLHGYAHAHASQARGCNRDADEMPTRYGGMAIHL